MRTLEAIAAVALIVLTFPLIVAGCLGVAVSGGRPLFRTESGEVGRLWKFNAKGRFGRLLGIFGVNPLPSLFLVVAGKVRLRDVIWPIPSR
jgi:hypothetical protein